MDLRIRLQATLVWPGAYSLQPPADRCANGVLQGECAYHLLRPPKLPLGGGRRSRPKRNEIPRGAVQDEPLNALHFAALCSLRFSSEQPIP
jgi:hypothetical protein